MGFFFVRRPVVLVFFDRRQVLRYVRQAHVIESRAAAQIGLPLDIPGIGAGDRRGRCDRRRPFAPGLVGAQRISRTGAELKSAALGPPAQAAPAGHPAGVVYGRLVGPAGAEGCFPEIA